MKLGYWLSSEEHSPKTLVENAKRAEDIGFEFAMISDHFHPWTTTQGQSSFVWSVLGAIAIKTTRLRVGTGVSCPILRIHPAILAQAAATIGAMMPGRFFLGLGTGELLNEHVLGQAWPVPQRRLEMLEEAVVIIRELWQGKNVNFQGEHYTVSDAQLFTRPEQAPPIFIAASGSISTKLAARIGDGLIGTGPNKESVQLFDSESDGKKPKIAQLTVCWAPSEEQAVRNAHQWWPTAALPGSILIKTMGPEQFDAIAKFVDADDVAKKVVCGPDPVRYLEAIEEYRDAGFDLLALHQIGPDQEGFMAFCQSSILPLLEPSLNHLQ